MANFSLRYPGAHDISKGAFRLLELPPDLAKVIEEGNIDNSITIRGKTDDDAVLCTKSKTYALRSVDVSNSWLVITGRHENDAFISQDGEETILVVRDELHDIMELVPIVPKLGRLSIILRESVYGEEEDMNGSDEEMDEDDKPPTRQRYTYSQMRGLVQASDAELDQGLKDQHILELDGELRPISPQYLSKILSIILNTLTSLNLDYNAVPLGKLSQELSIEHNIKLQITRQIARWFGEISDAEKGNAFSGKEVWKLNEEKVVQQIGLGVFIQRQHEALTEKQILKEWKEQVGDTFSDVASLSLLRGNIVEVSPSTIPSRYTLEPRYKYFPSSTLPLDPAKRFKDLFLTRNSWNIKQLEPFLDGIAVDKKERDKLLMKFTRSEPADAQGVVWYYSRAKT